MQEGRRSGLSVSEKALRGLLYGSVDQSRVDVKTPNLGSPKKAMARVPSRKGYMRPLCFEWLCTALNGVG